MGCFLIDEPEYLGKAKQCRSITRAKISCSEAYELSEPYLDELFEFREGRRTSNEDVSYFELKDYIYKQGDWYNICRENRESKSIYYYVSPAIRVHKDTGEVVTPFSE